VLFSQIAVAKCTVENVVLVEELIDVLEGSASGLENEEID
jgi:hypothetical protein